MEISYRNRTYLVLYRKKLESPYDQNSQNSADFERV